MIPIDPTVLGLLGFVAFMILLLIGIHIGVGMAAVGFFGIQFDLREFVGVLPSARVLRSISRRGFCFTF